MDIDPDAINT